MPPRALYFNGEPVDYQELKGRNPDRVSVAGANVYASDVFQALLKYSAFDQLLLPQPSRKSFTALRDSRVFRENEARIRWVAEHELAELGTCGEVVFLTPSANVAAMARLRRLSGCPSAPLTGLIHSLSYSDQLPHVCVQLMAPLQAHDALICSSTAGRSALHHFFRLASERFEESGALRFQTPVIPLGVDTALFAATAEPEWRRSLGLKQGPAILYFGRFSAASKADLLPLILVFGRLQRAFPEAQLVLAGDDTHFECAEQIRAFCRSAVPRANVLVVPNPTIQVKRQLYACADVFVSPSDSLQETFGLTVVEAMSAGLPVVASDWDGYKDLVAHGETGFLVRTILPAFEAEFEDLRSTGSMLAPDMLAATTMVDPEDLEAALGRLLGDGELRRGMGAKARARAAERYDWRAVVGAYESLWTNLRAAYRPYQPFGEKDLLRWTYRDAFSHYATEVLDDGMQVQLAACPPAETAVLLFWMSKVAGSRSWFRHAVFERVLSVLRQRGRMSVRELCEVTADGPPLERALARAHVYRMIKYGLVAVLRDE